MIAINEFVKKANNYAKDKIPFVFLIDFEMQQPFLCTVEEAAWMDVFIVINGETNIATKARLDVETSLAFTPIDFQTYKEAYEVVMKHLKFGNTYLANLTFPTPITTNESLMTLFCMADAPYKLFFRNKFIVYSPECFVKSVDNHLFSYPMKGTIDADIPDAEDVILADTKEEWEHNTIVDLIRNDLALVTKNVTVTKFRFISKIKTSGKNLLQVSSEIRGELPGNWQHNIGDMILRLLPAGSISGAPKSKTIEIIREAENGERGYYTGVFGIFDGENIDSAVNIRYIEKTAKGLQYRSGGGITAKSDAKAEYQEMLNKIYVPIR